MKVPGTTYWNSPNTESTNESGFSVLPGGYRNNDGSFNNIKNNAFYWSATENDNNNAWIRNLTKYLDYRDVYRFDNFKSVGTSIRCLKD